MARKGEVVAGMLCVVTVLLMSSLLHAQVEVEKRVTLLPMPGAATAAGQVFIMDEPDGTRGPGQRRLKVTAEGLEPGAVYSVWFLNEQPEIDMVRIGDPGSSFVAGPGGTGVFTAFVPDFAPGRWRMIQVARHPDGNPRNIANMEVALKAYIE